MATGAFRRVREEEQREGEKGKTARVHHRDAGRGYVAL
jgi:hypothetical protein